jgi:hypothetical protein
MAQQPAHQFSTEQIREAFEYLDELRESGRTNMFGAQAYVERELGWPRADASAATRLWMETFDHEVSMADRVAKATSA